MSSQDKINSTQLKEVQHELQVREVDIDKFHRYFGIKHLHELTIKQFESAMRMLAVRTKKPQQDSKEHLNSISYRAKNDKEDEYKSRKDVANKIALDNLAKASECSLGKEPLPKPSSSTAVKKTISGEQVKSLKAILTRKLAMPETFARGLGYPNLASIPVDEYSGAILEAKNIGYKK